ncbi:porin [Bacterioplanoides sp.]|uniref:porin n=1 Tax=Bacterioplanoides sp. TaxID=2066072 RepID=UPI003B5BA361
MLKKSTLAIAVSSAVFASSVYAEPTLDLYGRVDLGLEYYSDSENLGGADIFAGLEAPKANTDEKGFSLSDGNNSRLGVKGEAQLPNGLTTAYQYELGTRILDGNANPFVRYGWLSISNGQHTLTAGTQDNYLLMYGGLNAQYSEVHGYGAYYYATEVMPGSMAQTFRTDSTLAYTFGGGAFSGDTFTATVALHINEDTRTTEAPEPANKNAPTLAELAAKANFEAADLNKSGITGVTVGVESNLDKLALTAAYQQSVVSESDAAKKANIDVPSPSVASVGARYDISDVANVGFNYYIADRDTKGDSGRDMWVLGGDYQLSENLNLHAGFGAGSDDADTQRQMDANVFAQLTYTLSDSNQIRFEFEQASLSKKDDAGKKVEGDAQVFLISLRQDF